MLAEQFGSDVMLLEVLPALKGPPSFSMAGTRIAAERDARAHLTSVANEIRDVAGSVEIATVGR